MFHIRETPGIKGTIMPSRMGVGAHCASPTTDIYNAHIIYISSNTSR